MPTEHEYKHVIALDAPETYFKENCKEHHIIRQGYLAFSKGMTCRVRSSSSGIHEGKRKLPVRWFLTFKQKVRNRVVEVESKLDDRDGQDLWSACVGRLKKDRYVLEHEGVDWEIDFFKKGGHLYFVLAEVELEEGADRTSVPPFLQKWLLHEVALTDDRFGNKRLADVEHATNLYNRIVQGVIDENESKEAED